VHGRRNLAVRRRAVRAAADTSPPGNNRRAFNSTNEKGRTRGPAFR